MHLSCTYTWVISKMMPRHQSPCREVSMRGGNGSVLEEVELKVILRVLLCLAHAWRKCGYFCQFKLTRDW